MDSTLVTAALLGILAFAAILIARARRREGAGTSSSAPPGGAPISYSPAEAETWVRARIVEIAEAQFPDNVGLEWRVHQIQDRGGLLFVEVEPVPDEVGYPRFQFAFTYADAPEPDHVATYCLEAGAYTLLSTSRNAPKLPRALNPA